jgi:hypothetical protein
MVINTGRSECPCNDPLEVW